MKFVFYKKPWQRIVYKQTKLENGFDHWSPFVDVEADPKAIYKETKKSHSGVLNWLMKHFMCRRYAVLRVTGPKDAKFFLGYCSNYYVMKLSPIEQSVSNGNFAVRVFSDKNHFFVVSNENVELHLFSYFVPDTPVGDKYDNMTVY
ncbi:MAG: hypothetical protein WCG01_01320 [bacterium]